MKAPEGPPTRHMYVPPTQSFWKCHLSATWGALMKRYGSVTKAAVLTAVACIGMAVTTGSATAATASAKTWTIGATPANDDVALTTVSCSGHDNCIAVGTTSHYYGGTPVVYKWNGRAWESLPLPPGAAYLLGVACPTITYCIVVGQGTDYLARAWSWNGSGWTN